MGTERLRFVDGIDTANERLDLNDLFDANDWGGFHLVERPEFPPPPLRRTFADSWTDGSELVDASYENRELRFRLLVKGALDGEDKPSVDDMADRLTLLARELDRDRNVLEWRPDGASSPVFFRTYRSPMGEPRKTSHELPGARELELVIAAEPFAYGPRQTALNLLDFYVDPAHLAQGLFVDLPAIQGDVLTPLLLRTDDVGTTAAPSEGFLALRRHGDPGAMIWSLQAENMSQHTDTSVQPFSTRMSGGPGGNFSKITYGTTGSVKRLSATWPSALASLDYRGTYRVWMHYRAGSSTVVDVAARYAGIANSSVRLTEGAIINSAGHWVDLGLIQVPTGADPGAEGYDALAVTGAEFALYSSWVSGDKALEPDVFCFITADEDYCGLRVVSTLAADRRIIFDGPNDQLYTEVDSTGVRASTGGALAFVGAIPSLDPQEANRLFMGVGGVGSTFPDHWKITVLYWPRYLYLRS